MALAASTVFECRTGATALNLNSGGFNPLNATVGTDKSQSNTSAYTFTDLASSNATSSTPTITSASRSFDSTDPGNLIHINTATGNWTSGLYEIVSVSGGGAVLDRACGTAASVSGATYHVGGAMSLQNSSGFTDIAFFNSLVAGNKVWIQGGTYTLTATLGITVNGNNTAQISVEGYNSVRGDKPAGSLRPVFASQLFSCGNNFNFTSMIFSSNVVGAQVTPGTRCSFFQCKFVQSTTTANQAAVLPGNHCSFLNCEFICYAGRGLQCGNEILVANSYFHDSDTGIYNSNTTGNYGSAYFNNIFDSMVTACINYPNACDIYDVISGNTFYGCNKTGSGILFGTGAGCKTIVNNIFTNLATGVNVTDTSGALQGTTFFLNWNNFNNNTTDVTNCTKGPSDIALAPNFTNVGQLTGTSGVVSGSTLTVSSATGITANQDFVYIISGTGATAGQYLITGVAGSVLTLSSAPGGSGTNIVYQVTTGRNFYPGKNMQSVGSIGAFPGGLTTGYQTIGAIQRAVPLTLATTWIG